MGTGAHLKKQSLQHWILASDLIWMLIAGVLAYLLRYGLVFYPTLRLMLITYVPVLAASAILWAGLFPRMKLDGFRLGWHLPAIVSQLFLASCAVVTLAVAISYLVGHYVSRLVLAYWAILVYIGFLVVRRVANGILRSKYLKGSLRRVVIVGNGPVAREMASKIERHPEMLCEVIGYLCSADASIEAPADGTGGGPVKVQTLGIVDLLRDQAVDEIIITLTKPGTPEVMNLAALCRKQGIAVSIVPHPYELYVSTPELIDIGGLPLLKVHDAEPTFANGPLKRLLDVAISCGLLLACLPVVLLVSLGLMRKKGGPFIREVRCGRQGEPFLMYRLNSDRNSTTLPPFERLLQQMSITELPQLWNVVLGDMSLVGPRPESSERVKHYSDWQRQRLNVRPGITGLAQVHGLREQHSSEEKARFDLQYILHSSPFVDLSLLLQTGWTLVGRLLQFRTSGASQTNRVAAVSNTTFEALPNAHSSQSGTN